MSGGGRRLRCSYRKASAAGGERANAVAPRRSGLDGMGLATCRVILMSSPSCRSASIGCLALLLGLAGGCTFRHQLEPTRDVGHADSGRYRFPRPDGGRDGGHDAGPRRCDTDLECAAGQLCFGHACQPDPCATMSPCGATQRCRATCVALRDPCEGVTCAAHETCVEGACFAGCLPVTCEGVTCVNGWYCNPANGHCEAVVPCDAVCGHEQTCNLTCAPHSACEGVTCPEGRFCRAGACLTNPCFGVHCASGEVCNAGACVATCDCVPSCRPPQRCIDNICACIRSCPAGAACGLPDGCGGFCGGTCAGADEVCNADTGRCECWPACSASARCGAPDGCGGRCDGPCEGGLACVAGACTCTGECVAHDMIVCGTDIPPTCLGSHACSGRGTRCPAGTDCDAAGSCCPLCPTAANVPCGATTPSIHDADGHSCRTCTEVGTMCRTGTSCVSPPGTTLPTDRACCAECASSPTLMCGARIPDVLDDTGHVCRTCGGFGTAGCTAGTTCTGGADGTCCPSCAASSSVTCGDPIPSPACRTCSGAGSMCPSGTSCVSPPGTTLPTDRECCGLCASAASVPCGSHVPDVVASDGSVCRTCATGSMCESGSTCMGSACCPACPSVSGSSCGVPIPDQHDATGAVCRTCGTGNLCASGSTCAGGSCCPTCPAAGELACGTTPTASAGCPMCASGTMCPAGERCGASGCCATTCSPASLRACGDAPSDGCGGTCSPGTMCSGIGDTCRGSPLQCSCTPSCVGRLCGESNGCGGECIGDCDPGFQCSEHLPPTMPRRYECVPSQCIPSCGLCESCLLDACEPMTCASNQTACLLACECCDPGEVCMSDGCRLIV